MVAIFAEKPGPYDGAICAATCMFLILAPLWIYLAVRVLQWFFLYEFGTLSTGCPSSLPGGLAYAVHPQ